MHFGADGKLYVGVGENATRRRRRTCEPVRQAAALQRGRHDPADNPFFATQSGLARAIWAYGLRNPFTFAVQPGTAGSTSTTSARALGGDRPRRRRRELRLAEARKAEQRHRGHHRPLFAYSHDDANPLGSGPGGFFQGFAIAGGAFYPPAGAFPAGYRDQYYFADFVSQFVGRLDVANGNAAYAFARLSGAPVDLLVGQRRRALRADARRRHDASARRETRTPGQARRRNTASTKRLAICPARRTPAERNPMNLSTFASLRRLPLFRPGGARRHAGAAGSGGGRPYVRKTPSGDADRAARPRQSA
jgi:hypothetical protein